MTLLQAALGWAIVIAASGAIWAAALTGRRRQARRDHSNHLTRMHATGQITDAGLDRLRAAIHAHRDGPA